MLSQVICRVVHEPVDLASEPRKYRLSLSSSASYSWPDPTRLVLYLGRIFIWALVIMQDSSHSLGAAQEPCCKSEGIRHAGTGVL